MIYHEFHRLNHRYNHRAGASGGALAAQVTAGGGFGFLAAGALITRSKSQLV